MKIHPALSFFSGLVIAQSLCADDAQRCAPECPMEELCSDPCDASGRFFISASFLYWNAARTDLGFAVTQGVDVFGTDPPKTVNADSELVNFDYAWAPGVRGTLGYTTCDCAWDFLLTGVYFSPTSKKESETIPVNLTPSVHRESLLPVWNPSFVGYSIESAKAKWELDFATIDLLASRHFISCDDFDLSLNFGLRTAWINQEFKVDYRNAVFLILNGSSLVSVPHPDSSAKYSSHLQTIGFKGGLDFEVCTCSYLSLIGSCGGSLSYGRTHLKAKILGATPNSSGILENAITITNKQTIDKIFVNLESEIGLATSFCNMFTLSASYMFDIWFDQSDFVNALFSTPSTFSPQTVLFFSFQEKNYGNLMIQGLVVRAEIAF